MSDFTERAVSDRDMGRHTVEELQEFSNTRTPSPPWVRVVRIHVPMSSCDDAAEYLIKALGGEEVTRRVVGGTRWWQVRGVKGYDIIYSICVQREAHGCFRAYRQNGSRPRRIGGKRKRDTRPGKSIKEDKSLLAQMLTIRTIINRRWTNSGAFSIFMEVGLQLISLH